MEMRNKSLIASGVNILKALKNVLDFNEDLVDLLDFSQWISEKKLVKFLDS